MPGPSQRAFSMTRKQEEDVLPPLDYGLYDADMHYFEPVDCFTRNAPKPMRDRMLQVKDLDGKPTAMLNGQPFAFLSEQLFNPFGAPQELNDFISSPDWPAEEGDALQSVVLDTTWLDESPPELRKALLERDARIEWMTEKKIEGAVLYPTLGLDWVGMLPAGESALIHTHVESFNRWLLDDWGFNTNDRLYSAPLIVLHDRERAIAELDWVLENGARMVYLIPGPYAGRSPADAFYDPIWARLAEARVPVVLHVVILTHYGRMLTEQWGEPFDTPINRMSPWLMSQVTAGRYVSDTIMSMVFWNLFGRFPDLRIVSLENSAIWVEPLMRAMDQGAKFAIDGPWPGGRIQERPSDIFKQHVWVSPFQFEDVPRLAGLIGADRVLFGSDYPHSEGIAEPAAFANELEGLEEVAIRQIMRENQLALLSR